MCTYFITEKTFCKEGLNDQKTRKFPDGKTFLDYYLALKYMSVRQSEGISVKMYHFEAKTKLWYRHNFHFGECDIVEY